MSNVDYKITEIKFSARVDVKGEGSNSPQKHQRVTTLTAHVMYSYNGLKGEESNGAVNIDIATIGTAEVDEYGRVVAFKGETYEALTQDGVLSESIIGEICKVVEGEITSCIYREVEESHVKSYLAGLGSIKLPDRYSERGIGEQA